MAVYDGLKYAVLDVGVVGRLWLNDAKCGQAVSSPHAPKPWLAWVNGRRYAPLKSAPSKLARSKRQQLPATPELALYISTLHAFYESDAFAFEQCAMELARLFMPAISSWELTRPWRDGGRDALGAYRIGHGAGAIDVEFALEAKCYRIDCGVGVRAVSRLISRLRHRQFGILVTTSYLDAQAYQELIEDEHPVVVIAAVDIAMKLKEKFGSIINVRAWLQSLARHPPPKTPLGGTSDLA